MPEWKSELQRRLAGVPLAPEREAEIVEELAQHLADRYQELRTAGATEAEARHLALDEISEDSPSQRPNPSYVTARDEVKKLIDALKLPIDDRGRRRAAARAEWVAAADKPLDTHDLLA